jgi:peptide/nickel transport system substrate-binding protein
MAADQRFQFSFQPINGTLGRSLAIAMVLGGLVVSCRPNPPAANTGRISLGTTSKVRTLDPADAYEFFAGNLLYNLGERLYTYELGSNRLQPQLATALPTVSPDGLTYTIQLRQGVLFHDGTPFNAEAMAFSLKRFIQNGGQPSFLLGDLVQSVQATKPFELQIQLKKRFVGFPALLAFSGLCAVSPNAYAIGEGKFQPAKFVGTGPYRLSQYGNDSIRLDPFDRYWGTKPVNQGIDIQVLSSSAILFNAFRTRTLDAAYQRMDLDQIRSLQLGAKAGKWTITEGKSDGIYYLTLNLQSPPLDRLEVRQAIAALLDRTLIRDRIFRGQVSPLYSLVPNTYAVYQPVFQSAYGDANITKAKQLLQQAGYSATKPLVIELWYRSNITTNGLVANLLRAYAKLNMGGILQFDLKGVESATAYQNLDKGAYPMFILDWSADFLDADSYLQPFVECSKGKSPNQCTEGASKQQGSFFMSDRANQLITQSRQELNPKTRNQMLTELQTIVAQEVPFIPLWQTNDYLFTQRSITGTSLEATQKVPFWTLRKNEGNQP